MTTPTRSTLADKASSNPYAEHALDAADQALENTRQFATQAFDKAGEKMRELRSGVKDLASKGASTVGAAVAALVLALRRSRDE